MPVRGKVALFQRPQYGLEVGDESARFAQSGGQDELGGESLPSAVVRNIEGYQRAGEQQQQLRARLGAGKRHVLVWSCKRNKSPGNFFFLNSLRSDCDEVLKHIHEVLENKNKK